MLTNVALLRCSPPDMPAPSSAWQPRQVQQNSPGTYHFSHDPSLTPDSSSALILSIPDGVTKAPISALPASLEPLASQTEELTVPVVPSTAIGPSALACAPAEPLDVMLTLLDPDVPAASMQRHSSLTLSRGLSAMLDSFYNHGKDGHPMSV